METAPKHKKPHFKELSVPVPTDKVPGQVPPKLKALVEPVLEDGANN